MKSEIDLDLKKRQRDGAKEGLAVSHACYLCSS